MGGRAWRVVEAQHRVSTRKLVDSADEQAILEGLLERSKPPLPTSPGPDRLHYLLTTPFRYPPLPHGSRFGRRGEPSLWYGSTRLSTALAETAYYRLVFVEGSSADLAPLSTDMSAFRARWRSGRSVDLRRAPFDAHRAAIASPVEYTATQALGSAMRADRTVAFRYPSARQEGGVNVGLFTPEAFAETAPSVPETWRCVTDRHGVEFTKDDFFTRLVRTYPRTLFEVDGRVPFPAP